MHWCALSSVYVTTNSIYRKQFDVFDASTLFYNNFWSFVLTLFPMHMDKFACELITGFDSDTCWIYVKFTAIPFICMGKNFIFWTLGRFFRNSSLYTFQPLVRISSPELWYRQCHIVYFNRFFNSPSPFSPWTYASPKSIQFIYI